MGQQGLEILIVDDQAGVRFLLDTIVKEEGHLSLLATNGLEAVEMVKKFNPHLIFMDIRMPVMNGVTALQKMRDFGYDREVVIMTAYTDKDVLDSAVNNGLVRCIIKPFDVEEIRSIIREAASNHFFKVSAL